MRPEIYIFDFDGPIAKSAQVVKRVYNGICAHYGIKPCLTRADLSALFEEGSFYETILHKHPGAAMLAFRSHFEHVLSGEYHKVDMVRNMDDVLDRIAMKNEVWIVSDNFRNVILNHLGSNEVNIGMIKVLGAETQVPKRDRLRAIRSMYKKAPAFFITDTKHDITEARAVSAELSDSLGMRSIAVTWGYHPRETLLSGYPDFIVDQVYDVLEFVDGDERLRKDLFAVDPKQVARHLKVRATDVRENFSAPSQHNVQSAG